MLEEMVQDWLIAQSGRVPVNVQVHVGIGEIFVSADMETAEETDRRIADLTEAVLDQIAAEKARKPV